MELATHKTVTAMKPKNIFSIFIIMMSICLFSCSKNEGSNGGGNGDGTEVENDYTATADIKTVTLKTKSNYADVNGEREITIYEDYNNRYRLWLAYGEICLRPDDRENGYFSSRYDYNGEKSGIHDLGKVSSLQDIMTKEKANDGWFGDSSQYSSANYCQHSTVQPNHGYSAYFTTENDELMFVRIYIKDYTLNTSGTLTSITIQYQLY